MSNRPSYSYDAHSAPYSPVEVSQSAYQYSNYYPRGYDQQSNSQQYYLPSPGSNAHGHPSDPHYRSTTPIVAHTQRYSRGSGGDTRYSASSGLAPSSSSTNSGYYGSQYPTSQSNDRFIPTPSEIAHSPSYLSNQRISQSPGAYSTPGHHQQSRHSRNPSTSPVLTGGRQSSASRTSPTTE
ncbi:hypothetical protein PQX77_011413, partial [Marasmius sp. AFHP31]